MQCIFCHKMANSKEHVWGAWLRKVYPITDVLTDNRHIEDRNDRSGGVVPSRGQFTGGEHPLFKTSKVVCTDCNNNWMSQLEATIAKQFPRIFITKKTQIAPADFASLQKWCFLKFCIIEAATEHALPSVIFELELVKEAIEKAETARRKRNANFYSSQEIPDDYYVYIGRSLDVLQHGSAFCIASSQQSITSDRRLIHQERLTFLGCMGDMHFLVTNHKELIGYVHSRFFSRRDGIVPLTNPKFRVTEIPLAAMNSSNFEDDILTFLEKLENRTLRRNFQKFDGQVHIIPPRTRNPRI